MGAQGRRRLHNERGSLSIDGRLRQVMLRQAEVDARKGAEGVVEVGRSVGSRNLTFGVVSYRPESCKT